jgi:anti-sigma factor RsiW
MSDETPNLDELLPADPEDPGCQATLELLHLYVEADLSGVDPATRFAGVAAHLRSCPACRLDYEGLRAAVTAFRSNGSG